MSQVFFLFLSMCEGCYISLGDREKAKELFGKVPTLLDKRKYGGKELPTEVLIKKQSNYDILLLRYQDLLIVLKILVAFYKAKAKRRCNDETKYVDEIKISIAEGKGSSPIHYHLNHTISYLSLRTRYL